MWAGMFTIEQEETRKNQTPTPTKINQTQHARNGKITIHSPNIINQSYLISTL